MADAIRFNWSDGSPVRLAVAIPLPPKAWAVGNAGYRGRGWQKPKKLEQWQHAVYAAVRSAVPEDFREFEGVVRLDLVFIMHRPKRLCRAKDPDGFMWHPKRPDRVNLCKAFEDALDSAIPEGCIPLLADDAQIVVGETIKLYAEKGGEARMLAVIDTELDEAPTAELERMGVLELL